MTKNNNDNDDKTHRSWNSKMTHLASTKMVITLPKRSSLSSDFPTTKAHGV